MAYLPLDLETNGILYPISTTTMYDTFCTIVRRGILEIYISKDMSNFQSRYECQESSGFLATLSIASPDAALVIKHVNIAGRLRQGLLDHMNSACGELEDKVQDMTSKKSWSVYALVLMMNGWWKNIRPSFFGTIMDLTGSEHLETKVYGSFVWYASLGRLVSGRPDGLGTSLLLPSYYPLSGSTDTVDNEPLSLTNSEDGYLSGECLGTQTDTPLWSPSKEECSLRDGSMLLLPLTISPKHGGKKRPIPLMTSSLLCEESNTVCAPKPKRSCQRS